MKQNVTKFEVGKTYIAVSPCNTDARWKLKGCDLLRINYLCGRITN